MLKKLLIATALLPFAAGAQTVSTFESHSLGNDTFYANYSAPGQDVGFNDGLAYFPAVFDTSASYQFLSYGFVYSNKRDSVTPGFTNEYSAITDTGFGPSAKYAVAYGLQNIVRLTAGARGHAVRSFYITNSTYVYKAIRDGYGVARKFGDTTGTRSGLPQGAYPDWYKLTVRGYFAGALKSDSVEFYLADYRFNNSANDYIVKSWEYVNLLPLGHVDSLQFSLSSSDNDSAYGMNTPAYFCMDNFTTNESDLSISPATLIAAKLYPNPVQNVLNIILQNTADVASVTVFDAGGREVRNVVSPSTTFSINLESLASGVYFISIRSHDGRTASQRFIKS